MKSLSKLGVLTAVLAAVPVMAPGAARAQDVQDFSISDFTANYYLDKNSANTATLHTVENITADFPNYDQNHGILRAIPQSYQGHTVSLVIDSVTNGHGTALPYSTSSDGDNLVLKIGDKNAYVHGRQSYKITYDQKNVISILPNDNEFYWDVNGDQWQQTFHEVQANIHVSQKLVANLLDKQACYAGVEGSNDTGGCTINAPVDGTGGQLITSTAGPLFAYQTLTVVVGFKTGTFTLGPEIAQAQRAEKIKIASIIAAMLVPPVLVFAFLYSRWRRFGRDPKGRGTIIPEYQPPKGLDVLSSDFILHEKLNNKAISALVLELAIKKYITIYEATQKKKLGRDSTTYSLKLIKDPTGLTSTEQSVVMMFFPGSSVGSEVDLSALKNTLASQTKVLKNNLGSGLLAMGYFSNDPNKAGTTYSMIGGALVLIGLFILGATLPLAAPPVVLSGLIFVAFARYMPSRSDKGVETNDYLLGLRDYIKLAEADRLNYLQSPQGAEKVEEAGLDPKDPKFKVKLFESLLPYAMIFNLEKQWAKEFQDVYTSPPDWYNGNWSTFNTVYLASSIAGFNSASTLSFTPAGSSSSSGFGGGGFSGGGGGGGGGGGW